MKKVFPLGVVYCSKEGERKDTKNILHCGTLGLTVCITTLQAGCLVGGPLMILVEKNRLVSSMLGPLGKSFYIFISKK